MGDKILVPFGIDYKRALGGLGDFTGSVADFFRHTADYKLVLFTGGADVSPIFYYEPPAKLCYCDFKRDRIEMDICSIALKYGVKMTGICRGAQFLNVMAGGRMMHHLDNHGGCMHMVQTAQGDEFTVNSLHHQMIVPSEDAHVIAWSKRRLSKIYRGKEDKLEDWKGLETEAVIIPAMGACGVQWHPEIMNFGDVGYEFFYRMVKDMIEMEKDEFVVKYTKGATAGYENDG